MACGDDEFAVKKCLIMNLDTRRDLWADLQPQIEKMERAGIEVAREPGVNYKDTPNLLSTLIKEDFLSLKASGLRKNVDHMKGELGCARAHFNALKRVVDNDWDSCLIMEDGVEFLHDDFAALRIKKWLDISICYPHLKEDAEGAQAYIVTQQGARKMLKALFPLELPYDIALRNTIRGFNLAHHFNEPYLVKRRDKRESSIGLGANECIQDRCKLTWQERSAKQSMVPLYERIIRGLIEKRTDIAFEETLFAEP
jgi:GR25 family glycosyltransferase involved in LPS biosynthesis